VEERLDSVPTLPRKPVRVAPLTPTGFFCVAWRMERVEMSRAPYTEFILVFSVDAPFPS